MAPDSVGRVYAHAGRKKTLSRLDDFARDDAVPHDLLVVVDVVQKKVQGENALLEADFDMVPFIGLDDPGHHVEGEDLFRALFVTINRERDAEIVERLLGLLLPPEEFAFGQGLDFLDQKPRAVAGNAGSREHFVMKRPKVVAGKFHKQPQVLTSL